MKRNALVFVTLFAAILAMLASGKYLQRSRKHGPIKLVGNVQGVPAPDFTLPSLDGSKIKLSDFRGKAVLLNFWATWCPPCKVEMPWFAELQKQYGKDGLVVLGVAMDDSEPASIAKFASRLGVNYPVLLGTDQVSDDYGDVQYLPTTFYIARNGTIVDKMIGLLDRKQIEEAVKKTLNTTYKPTSALQNQAQAEVNTAADRPAPLAGVAFAQSFADKPPVVMAPVGNVQVRAGSSKDISLDFRIGSEFHINSHTPKSPLLIPTVLKLTVPEQLTVADVRYPAGQDMSFAFSPDEKLSVYSGDFSIDAVLKTPANVSAGTYPVKGELRFQACDHSACYPPRTIPVHFPVTVVK